MATTADAVTGDPVTSFQFSLELMGMVNGFFTEVSGLGSESDVIEHKLMTEIGVEIIRKIPGRKKWNDLTLKRGITRNMDIWIWRKMVTDGLVDAARVSGSVHLHDQMGVIVATWIMNDVWPTKVSGPTIKADDNSIAIEELTITYEYIERVL